MTAARAATEHPAPAGLRWLPAFLFRAEHWRAYVLKAWLLALLPSIALAALVTLVSTGGATPEFGSAETLDGKAVLAFALVVVGPFAETLIMGALLWLLRLLVGFTPAIFLSALAWGLAHSFGPMVTGGEPIPAWGLVVWWPFLILSIAYLTWRPRGLLLAIGTATVIHGLQNSVAAAGLLLA